jgi:predicted DNA-binding WGR domain protein
MMAIVTRYFECKTGGSSKFWILSFDDEVFYNASGNTMNHSLSQMYGIVYKKFSTRWGKIGTSGTEHFKLVQNNDFQKTITKLIEEKKSKGYKEVAKTAGTVKSSVSTDNTYLELL